MEIRTFILNFFQYYQSEIVEDGPLLRIKLNPKHDHYSFLKQELGENTFCFAFDLDHVADGVDLVTTGNPILDRIHQLLRKQGHKAVLEFPKTYKVSKKVLRQKLDTGLQEKIPYQLKQSQTFQENVYFLFKVNFVSEVGQQEFLIEEGLDARHHPIHLENPELLKKGKDLPSWKPPAQFSALYETALLRVSEKVKIRATHQEKLLWEELKKMAIRVQKYYEHQIQDIPNKDFLVQSSKVAKLQKENQNQLKKLPEQYQLEIAITLLNYQVLKIPYQVFELQFAKGSYQAHFNNLKGKWEPFYCKKCQKNVRKFYFSEEGQLYCKSCVQWCSVCKQISSQELICSICEQKACETCLVSCGHCDKHICKSHQENCTICSEKICQSCTRTCTLCANQGCKAHFTIYESDPYCLDCNFSCKYCHRSQPKSFRKTCNWCGQISCKSCFQTCSQCQNEYCPIHESCKTCGEEL